MTYEISLRQNFFNFVSYVPLGPVTIGLRFTYSERADRFILDLLHANGEPLDMGLECATGVALNDRIRDLVPGTLFFHSSDGKSYATKRSLGTTFRLYYYEPDALDSSAGTGAGVPAITSPV